MRERRKRKKVKGREGKEEGEGTLIMNPNTLYVIDGMDKNCKV